MAGRVARRVATSLFFLGLAAACDAQDPAPPDPAAAATAAPNAPTPPAAPNTRALLDEFGGMVESGRLDIAIDMVDGKFAAAPAWTVVTSETPRLSMTVEAAQGRIGRLDASLSGGKILVSGRGLRPKVYVEAFAFEDGKGLTSAKFHGKGIWKPIVAIFRGVAMSTLRKLQLRTDIPSVLRGEVLASTSAPSGAAPPPAPESPAPAAPAGGPSFLDLVGEVHVTDSHLIAYPGKPLTLGQMVRFQTASGERTGFPLRVTVDKGLFAPGHGGAATRIDLEGRIDGEIENGALGFGDSQGTFSRGELRSGSYHVWSKEGGGFQTEMGAASFSLDLTSGEVHLPGGPEISVDPPSRLGFRDLHVFADGTYSGLVDADLHGKVGRITRAGSTISAADIRLRTQGTKVSNGRADGDLDLQFLYRVEYPLIVHYPVEELGDRRVPLVFQGPFSTRLHVENATKDGGSVTGDYAFKIPWAPVEKAAVELLRARWSQDIKAVIRNVDFTIEPRRFGPCGGTCFLVELGLTAEKKNAAGKNIFQQICEPEGKADLFVDAPTRSFQLRNIKLLPRCKGVVGWVINFIAPLLTKTYTDMTVFQMPAGLPFSVESVGSGADYVSIAGRVAWEASEPTPPAAAPPGSTAQ
jgi:hypothetical protein